MHTAVGYTSMWTFTVALRHPKGIEIMQSICDWSGVCIKKKKKKHFRNLSLSFMQIIYALFFFKTFTCRVPFSLHFYDDQPTSQVPTRLSSSRAFIRAAFISAPLRLYRSLLPRAICRICILPPSPSCNCSFITALVFWKNASHPVGLSNICRTASVRRLCESWHSPTVSSSPGVSIWSLLRWLSRLKWGFFCLMTVTQIWDLFYQQEVPVCCWTRQKSPPRLLRFSLTVFHLVSISVSFFSAVRLSSSLSFPTPLSPLSLLYS